MIYGGRDQTLSYVTFYVCLFFIYINGKRCRLYTSSDALNNDHMASTWSIGNICK